MRKRFIITISVVAALLVLSLALAGIGFAASESGAEKVKRGHGVKGEVSAVDGSGFTLKTKDTTLTVTTSQSTVYDLGGNLSGKPSDVVVGARVEVEGDRSRSNIAASRVRINLDDAHGVISSITNTALNIKRGIWTTAISLANSPDVSVMGNPGSLSDLAPGQEVKVAGKTQGDVLVARAISVVAPHLEGKVTSKADNSLTLETRDGARQVVVSSNTQYRGKLSQAGFAGIQVGDRLRVEGSQASDPFQATAIDQSPQPKGHKKGAERGRDKKGEHKQAPQGSNMPASQD